MTRDNRIGLKNNTIIHFGNENFGEGKDVQITGEIGHGASCIVYDAIYLDNIGVQHKVRVKECYPSHLPIHRDEENRLIPSEYNRDKFVIAKKKFVDAYKQSAKIRNTLGLINSTINSTDTTSCNNTIYIKMELDEGSDYGKYEDGSLKSLFVHMKSLAQLIQKYHQNGYLYLDIKPENIFILPETDEHIILFDFDSVVTLEELAGNNRIGLSFSKGFSPPEQIQGQRDKIGKHTDIYSIGALTFYKLFNRVATSQECNISATYPFGEMNYVNEKYHPKLYRAINNFLRKTLSTAIIPRWHDMQPVIEALDELIKLSDIDGIYLLNSFQYDSAHFIGRNEEMEKIAEILSTNQLVFLSGIGGIGKTELAKQYANQYRDQYDTVTFSVFEKNIETLVCNEILIHKISQDEEESDTAYFERKIEILKQIATPRDLVIIDNFDVDSDEKLEILFRCPCKFIITTRMDFRDYNYKQIDVDRLRDPEDVLELFYTYTNKDYPGEENKAVERLVQYVGYHTMTVELIAKYLRNSEELPVELYGKFLQNEGTANTEEINVKQRKDGKLNLKSVNNHLKILFDVSGFDAIEQEMIRSLSLLAGIRIEKSKFYQLCAVDDGENKLELLIRSGWVEYHAVSGKISLHQVIQDLVYKELAPSAENCPKIVEGMGRYVDLETANWTEREIKEKFFEIFMERLSGNNLPYAKLCLIYGKENKLEEAEKICFNYYNYGTEVFDLLQRIYKEKMKYIIYKNDDDFISTDKIAFSYKQKLSLINELLDKSRLYCEKSSEHPDDIIKEYIKTGAEVHSLLAQQWDLNSEERIPELDTIYKKIMEMFNIATEQLPSTSFSKEEKIKLYEEIQDFYSNRYSASPYADKYFSNPQKAYQYQELIYQLEDSISAEHLPKENTRKSFDVRRATDIEMMRLETPDIFHILTSKQIERMYLSSCEKAEIYENTGRYKRALAHYKESLEKSTGTYAYQIAIQGIIRIYSKIGRISSELPFLEQTIANEIEVGSTYIKFIKALEKSRNLKKAIEYAKKLIYYESSRALSGNDSYSLTYVIFSYYFLYTKQKNPNKKNILWQKCLEYYKILGNNSIKEEIIDFIMEYLDKEVTDYKEIVNILNRIDNSYREGNKMQEKIIQQSIKKYAGKKDFEKYHVLFLMKLAKQDLFNNTIKRKKNCRKAKKYYKQYELHDRYLQSLIYETKANLLMSSIYNSDEVLKIKKLCDYKLLAEREISEQNYKSEEQIHIWGYAADEYNFAENPETEIICLSQALEIMQPMLNQDEFFNIFNNEYYGYTELIGNLITAYTKIRDFDSAYRRIIELYEKTIKYLRGINNFKRMRENAWNIGMDNAKTEIIEDFQNGIEGNLLDEEKRDDIQTKTTYLGYISDYFIGISKFDEAIRIYFIAMYLILVAKTDTELEMDTKLLKIGDDIPADIMRLCTIVNELLNQEIASYQIDSLVELKDKILEHRNLSSFNPETFDPIIAKISNKYQYKDIEFKQR